LNAFKRNLSSFIPGSLLAVITAAVAFITWWLLKDTSIKISALLLAFVFSIVLSNLIPAVYRHPFTKGIDFCATSLLKVSVALLGLTVSASVWGDIGGFGVMAVLLNLTFVFLGGYIFCRYAMRMSAELSILIAVGTSICGATAIAATGPAIRAKANEMGLSVAIITGFGLIAMFAYPWIFEGVLGTWFGGDPTAYGMWSGMGVHETAQVVAAASQIDGALDIAVSAKMIRIFMIGPMVFISLILFRKTSGNEGAISIRTVFPWFALAFVLMTLIHMGLEASRLSQSWLDFNATYLKPGVTFLMAWSFAAIGIKVRFASLKQIGWKGILAGMLVATLAGVSALLITKLMLLLSQG